MHDKRRRRRRQQRCMAYDTGRTFCSGSLCHSNRDNQFTTIFVKRFVVGHRRRGMNKKTRVTRDLTWNHRVVSLGSHVVLLIVSAAWWTGKTLDPRIEYGRGRRCQQAWICRASWAQHDSTIFKKCAVPKCEPFDCFRIKIQASGCLSTDGELMQWCRWADRRYSNSRRKQSA